MAGEVASAGLRLLFFDLQQNRIGYLVQGAIGADFCPWPGGTVRKREFGTPRPSPDATYDRDGRISAFPAGDVSATKPMPSAPKSTSRPASYNDAHFRPDTADGTTLSPIPALATVDEAAVPVRGTRFDTSVEGDSMDHLSFSCILGGQRAAKSTHDFLEVFGSI